MYQFISSDVICGFESDRICTTANPKLPSPDLFYNVVLFFDWQEHSGICILKPYQKMQSKQYGPGMLSLSPHGLWLITIAKCGVLCIRDVHTLVNAFFKKNHGVYILIAHKKQKPLGGNWNAFLGKLTHNLFTTDGIIDFNVRRICVLRFESLREKIPTSGLRFAKKEHGAGVARVSSSPAPSPPSCVSWKLPELHWASDARL